MVLQANIMMEETHKLQSVGYKNIAISDKHVSRLGGLLISVRSVIGERFCESQLSYISGFLSSAMRRSLIAFPLILEH